jgi:hypothetical protein
VKKQNYPKIALSKKWVKINFGSWKVVPQEAYRDLRFSWFAFRLERSDPQILPKAGCSSNELVLE